MIFREIISGPLRAFRFGMPGGVPLPKLGGIFNFGYVEIQKRPEDDLAHLTSRIADENGLTRPNSLLDLKPQQ